VAEAVPEEAWPLTPVTGAVPGAVPEEACQRSAVPEEAGLPKVIPGAAPEEACQRSVVREEGADTTVTFSLTVILEGKVRPNKYKYEVKNLPDPVYTASKSSFYKVERNDEVVVYLHKATPRQWNIQLDSQGLETIT
jgi:hypothetical protein